MFSSQMPYAKFILPTAPTQPVTLNGGMAMTSWYDIVGLDDRAAETCEGLQESRLDCINFALHRYIDDELKGFE